MSEKEMGREGEGELVWERERDLERQRERKGLKVCKFISPAAHNVTLPIECFYLVCLVP